MRTGLWNGPHGGPHMSIQAERTDGDSEGGHQAKSADRYVERRDIRGFAHEDRENAKGELGEKKTEKDAGRE